MHLGHFFNKVVIYIDCFSDDAGLESTFGSISETEKCDILQTDQTAISTNDTKSLHHCTKEQETETDSIERHSSGTIPSESGPTTSSGEQSEKVGRPRLFCLQHALQTEELLQNEGGARVLAICHSGISLIYLFTIAIPFGKTGMYSLALLLEPNWSGLAAISSDCQNLT